MKRIITGLASLLFAAFISSTVYAQRSSNTVTKINSSHLESYLTFLSSPLLKGRMNGEDGMYIAGQYIASQAKLIGLLPANDTSYFQPYPILKKTFDLEKTSIEIISKRNDIISINKPLFQLVPTGPSDFDLDGEVIFAGYGIKSDIHKYNDLEGINAEGKILLIMNRAPLTEDGKEFVFNETPWSSFMSIQVKLSTLLYSKAKAILIVMDPKSGKSSFDELYPGYGNLLTSSISLKGTSQPAFVFPGIPKVLFIHRSVADALLEDTGTTLENLQNNIDTNLKPNSFPIKGKHLRIKEVSITEEKTLYNIAGYIEGSDNELKNEVVIFSGHYDHIGMSGDKVNPGADDDASGCSALLSLAEAFQALGKKPLRSVLFLWVSGEEIGLYGSKSYVDNPLFPIDKTIVDLNMDMIGRIKQLADSTDETPMTGPDQVFVITANQSSDLASIAEEIDKKSPLDFDYSLSGKDHPQQLFARSDHYNFVKKDIPVLFFTSGIHSDYHSPNDIVEKIDFKKMELITRTMYEIGFTIANRKNRLLIDNPFSTWEKSK